MDAANKVAVIVGGGSGMGRATAELLAAAGAKIAILDLPDGRGPEAAKEIGATFHACDVTDETGTEAAIEEVVAAHGAIHIAVNTAGGGVSKRTIGKNGPLPLADFRSIIELNLIGTFNLNRLQAWHMSKNEPEDTGERGVIINTASIAAFEGQIGQVSYTAAKAGIAGMSLTMARDLGSLGIRVMAIAPSLFATGLLEGAPQEIIDVLTKDAAFPRRAGRPEEYAWLAESIVRNPMLNGQTIRLDGGQRFAPK
ncbi:NAD(P)-dependent dehydrogenase (short-subunit alcohol dehydrogenase family) [Actinocorallia herbida]|uniref:NAD(P)-dependent dehydrogenase (Short-subunit alcohol dehydrogenase family) n=1 Tax=Actinocorallia herbida TaxID=58109 RepID=A0A3N1CUT0_9ACTN|nr:SDR family NAD(P)-dependent oxidoreductase [Actinocorallia herbida]ROO84974.1 NAD(P)-dependent dehydrogenase (short-subunit alcohol dehydrogenase family) [Actinocorallia herbida]